MSRGGHLHVHTGRRMRLIDQEVKAVDRHIVAATVNSAVLVPAVRVTVAAGSAVSGSATAFRLTVLLITTF